MKVFRELYARLINKKTPLILLVAGQALSLYQWQMHTNAHAAYVHSYAAFILAVLTAFAIDGATVQIAFSKKRTTLQWVIALITSLVFAVVGVIIAVATTGDYMHGAFSVGVFLYSWFIALVINADEPLHDIDTVNALHDKINAIADAMQSMQQSYARFADIPEIQYTAIEVNEQSNVKHCPKCGNSVNAASYYRIKQRGYCNQCKS